MGQGVGLLSISREVHDLVLHRDFVLMHFGLSLGIRKLPALPMPDDLKRRQRIRQSLRSQRRTAILDMEVKMGLGRISRISDETNHLPTPHLVAQLHAQRTRLQMRIKRKMPSSYVEDHVVSAHGFQR